MYFINNGLGIRNLCFHGLLFGFYLSQSLDRIVEENDLQYFNRI